jgi:hypothetical protein
MKDTLSRMQNDAALSPDLQKLATMTMEKLEEI